MQRRDGGRPAHLRVGGVRLPHRHVHQRQPAYGAHDAAPRRASAHAYTPLPLYNVKQVGAAAAGEALGAGWVRAGAG